MKAPGFAGGWLLPREEVVDETEKHFDRMVAGLQSGSVNRRDFFRCAALLGVSLTTVTEVLSATPIAQAAETYALPPNWNPYPFSWA
jgi:hypothetical protein